MSPTGRAFSWLLPLALLGGCGGPLGALWVRVEAPFSTPDQADELKVTVVRARDSVTVFSQSYDLSSQRAFPLTLSLTTQDALNLDPQGLVVQASALHAGVLATSWAQGQAKVALVQDHDVQAVVRLCDCTMP